jgi:hypothetical protein
MVRAFLRSAVAAAACLLPAFASAQATLPTAFPGVLGQGRQVDLGALGTNYIRYTVTANRSYFAVCFTHYITVQVNICDIDWRNDADAVAGVPVAVEPFQAPFTAYAGASSAYLPAASGNAYLRVHNVSGDPIVFDVQVIETTLFSPWWYVLPSAAYDSWIQIRNNTEQDLPVTVVAYDHAGAVAGTTTQTVKGNGVILVQVGTLTPGGAGSTSLLFAGPPGAIAANTTTLSGSTGLSYDAPFRPRMQAGPAAHLGL